MLVLRSIEIDGFGPYVERQRLSFPAEGVSVVYGDNMRGKTSLLNAIRYALFGRVLGRGARERRLHTISNRDLAAKGQYGFSVVLCFAFDGAEYELLRACRPRRDRGVPTQDSDYDQPVQLRQGQDLLGPDERAAVLARVLPEQVSRFFLFDGELLDEYEELLHDESKAGRAISEAIERILGVPILTRGMAHLGILGVDAGKAVERETSKSQETESIGTALGQAAEVREGHKADLLRFRGELAELHDRRKEMEGYLGSVDRIAVALRDREACDARLQEIAVALPAVATELKEAMRQAWRTVLGEPVRIARAAAAKEAKEEVDSFLAGLRRKAADDGLCGTCDQKVDQAAASRIRASLESVAPVTTAEGPAGAAFSRLAALNEFTDRDVTGTARELWKRHESLRAEQAIQRDRRSDLMTEVRDEDERRVKSSTASLSEVMRKIAVTDQGITKLEAAIVKSDQAIERLHDKLRGLGSASLREAQARSQLLREAGQVFEAAVDRYKADLRGRVEATASDLFLRMSTEKEEYGGLEINENYGLHIVHKQGGVEEGRSAGAEHVVALALMGALQRNAPFRGPIVMDSPLFRLDPGHKTNVLLALPTLAPQVVLLVHEGEARRERVRELLGDHLVREYELVKLSARRTDIRPVT